MKRIIKIAGILLAGIFLALLVAPFVFKDKILAEIKKFANEQVNAKIDFRDVDVSFIKSFPEVSVAIKDIQVAGVDTFHGQNLLSAKDLILDFSLIPLFNSEAPKSIKYVSLEDANIDIVVLNDSLANYLISKPGGDTTGVSFSLEGYALKNCNLTYKDISLPLELELKGIQHEGSGDIASNVYDLNTTTTADSMTVVFDGFSYLKNVKTGLDAVFHIDLDKQLFELKDNSLFINQLKAKGNGSVQIIDKETMRITADLATLGNSFGELLSVFPYLSSFNTVKATGSATFAAKVLGDFNASQSKMPAFDLTLDIRNGAARYQGLDADIHQVNAFVKIKSTRSDMKDMEVDINKASVAVNQEKIAGSFKIRNGLTNPHITGNIKGGISLQNWRKAIPLPDLVQLQGKIQADLSFDATKADIDKENYAAIGFNGNALITDFVYQTKNNPVIRVSKAALGASPQKISIQTESINLGKSDLSVNGEILHPMAYFSEHKSITGKVNLTSQLLDLNEWTGEPAPKKEVQSVPAFLPDLSAYSFSKIDAKAQLKEIKYGNHTLKDLNGVATLGLENIDVKNFGLDLDGSLIQLQGKLANVYSWFTGSGILNGELSLKANKLDANAFMVKSEQTPMTEEQVVYKVPANVNLKMDAQIGQLKYTNMVLDKFVGNVNVENQTIFLSGLNAGTLGGKIGFDGLYDTRGDQPVFNVKIDLAKLEFGKAYNQFVTMKALAPLAAYINGVFNTTLVMEGKLGKGMIPDVSSLTVSGFIETLNGIIKGFAPLAAAGDKLGLKEVSQMELKDTRNWFEMKQGVIEIKEFTKNIAGIEVKGLGKHKVGGDMDYSFDLRIPRKMLSKNVVTGTVVKGLGFLEKEASRYGVNIAQGEFIDVRLLMGGKIKDPKITIKPLGTSGKSMQEELKEEAKAKLDKARDSIEKVVLKKKEELKDTIRSRAEEEVDKAKQKLEEKATDVVNETKDKVQKEVEKKLDTLVGKAVSDTLQKKAGEILKDKTGKDLEDVKNKVKNWNPFKKKN